MKEVKTIIDVGIKIPKSEIKALPPLMWKFYWWDFFGWFGYLDCLPVKE